MKIEKAERPDKPETKPESKAEARAAADARAAALSRSRAFVAGYLEQFEATAAAGGGVEAAAAKE